MARPGAQIIERIAEIARGRKTYQRPGVDYVVVSNRQALDVEQAVELLHGARSIAALASRRSGDHRSTVRVDAITCAQKSPLTHAPRGRRKALFII
jgi:hypothetical protein